MQLKLPDKQMTDDGNMLKRRLLGAAVLIALAVIALPLLLDGAGSESRFRRVEQLRQEPPRIVDSRAAPEGAATPAVSPPQTTVAAAPVAATGELASALPAESEPVRPQPAADAPVIPAAAEEVPRPVAPASAPVEVPALQPADNSAAQAAGNTAVPSGEIVDRVAWVVQAGSYGAQANAMALRDRLRTAGYPSFVSQGRNQGAAVFRVKVGPLNNRQRAAQVQSDVESLIGQSTLIRQYTLD